LASRGNFHFSLALKSKDAADAVLNMVAASMQALLVVYERVGDVAVLTISDDRIFEQTVATLRKGGSPAKNVSRSDAALVLLQRDIMAPPSRQQIAAKSSSDGWICDECNKTFATEMALEHHQEATGHSDDGASSSENVAKASSVLLHSSKIHSYGWICDECNKIFATERALNQHQEAKGHDYVCSCCKSFTTERALQQHQHDTSHRSLHRALRRHGAASHP
jgi:hypothetical protein